MQNNMYCISICDFFKLNKESSKEPLPYGRDGKRINVLKFYMFLNKCLTYDLYEPKLNSPNNF